MVGFQFVMKGIADRIKFHKVKKPFIVIDQQSQFNTTQKSLAQFYADAKASQHEFVSGPGLPDIDFSHMPEAPIDIKSGKDSYGLEIVDIYLWIFKRKLEGKFVAQELESFISKKYDKGMFDELSLQALENRWVPYFDSLPNLTTEQEAAHAQFLKIQEESRIKAIKNA